MPYYSTIPNEILLGIKRRNRNKIYCSYHLDEKLKLLHGQRVCIICNKRQKREGSKRYLQKKENEKNAKFQFFGVS